MSCTIFVDPYSKKRNVSKKKLHLGNPAPFGFDAPEEIVHDIVLNMKEAQGYCDAKGLFSARKAVMQHYQALGVPGVEIDDIYIGNGVSELIVMATQGLLNSGNEILIPCPDYPLWTAAANLSGGTPVHYRCDEQSGWLPDLERSAADLCMCSARILPYSGDPFRRRMRRKFAR